MQIQIIQSFVEKNANALRVYDVLDLPDHIAEKWISMGRARKYIPFQPLFVKHESATEPMRETATRSRREKAIRE